MQVASFSHQGRVRRGNEDRFHVNASSGVFIVADGMGGHAAGEVAAQITVDVMSHALSGLPPASDVAASLAADVLDKRRQLVTTAVKLANAAVWSRSSRDPACKGMGSTVVAAVIVPGGVLVTWLGDSRAYVERRHADGGVELTRLTVDHEEVAANGMRYIYLGIGVSEKTIVPNRTFETRTGDVLLLCSDGLYKELSDEDIAGHLSQGVQGADGMLDLALARGGQDNITAIVVEL